MKTININNIRDFSDIYMHDAEFSGFNFSYSDSTIKISVINNFPDKKNITLNFNDVFYFESINGALWGKGYNIFSCVINSLTETDVDILLNKEQYNEYKEIIIKDIIPKLLKVEIIINSGDTLVIFCSEIKVMVL